MASGAESGENLWEGGVEEVLALRAPKVYIWVSFVVYTFDDCTIRNRIDRSIRTSPFCGHNRDVDSFSRWQLWTLRNVISHSFMRFVLFSMCLSLSSVRSCVSLWSSSHCSSGFLRPVMLVRVKAGLLINDLPSRSGTLQAIAVIGGYSLTECSKFV